MHIDLKAFRPSFVKDADLTTTTPRKCEKCPTMLPPWLKRWCSYGCVEQAKFDGSYVGVDSQVA